MASSIRLATSGWVSWSRRKSLPNIALEQDEERVAGGALTDQTDAIVTVRSSNQDASF
jgi:hypothetical protein